MATVPAYVKSFLRELPRSWDDSKFIDGYPGSHAVIARKAGDKPGTWPASTRTTSDKTVTLDLSFLGQAKGHHHDGATEREFSQRGIAAGKAVAVTIKPHGGFVASSNKLKKETA
jgi:alpha-glucosidase